MSANAVNEQSIVEELHQIPQERWGEVLLFLRSLQRKSQLTTDQPILTGTDLAGSDLIGVWAERTDVKDGLDFARQLRQRAEQRQG